MAAIMLGRARLTVAALRFARWRDSLGGGPPPAPDEIAEAVRLAAHVEWAARLLPFDTKCLPRAMALSWLLRGRCIGHAVIFAVRPAETRPSDDDLHAWVEVAGKPILGDLPGPWVETLRLGESDV
jgi:hypothetical protein